MEQRVLIKNGTVVNASGRTRADVLIDGERVVEIGEGINLADADTIDAANCFVMPGFIDTHTHFDLDMGYTVTADDFITGTRAAILGGTTTVLDFATQDKGKTMESAYDAWMKKASHSSCNYGFHMAIVEWNSSLQNEIPRMRELGITSFKMYMAYDALRVDDGSIYSALKAINDEKGILGVHCENWDVLKKRIDEVKAEGILSPIGHPLSRPAPVEAEAVARYLRIAELARTPCYIVHLSSAEGLCEARRARERGQEVYLETCPQYLLLSDKSYAQSDGAKFVMSPPLRKEEDNSVLWNAAADGEIDFIGTDHCSFTMAQKARGLHDFSMIPNGGASVQHRPALIYTYGVCTQRISLESMVRLLAYNPSKMFGMTGRGEVRTGCFADIVIWDPNKTDCITDTNTAHNCDNSPFASFKTHGGARHVLLNGQHIVRDYALEKSGTGKYIAREGYGKIR